MWNEAMKQHKCNGLIIQMHRNICKNNDSIQFVFNKVNNLNCHRQTHTTHCVINNGGRPV